MRTHTSAWSADVEPALPHHLSCLPPSPVPCPDATRCRTAYLCNAFSVSTGRVVHDGSSPSFPAPAYAARGRCKERLICSGDHTLPQALLLSIVFLDMKHNATDRFMRDTVLCCYCTERFFLLHHRRPLGSGNSVCRVLWPWPPVLDHHRRMAYHSCFIFSKQPLHLEIQCARRGKEEVENGCQRSRISSVPPLSPRYLTPASPSMRCKVNPFKPLQKPITFLRI
jgi:hypothetical protein